MCHHVSCCHAQRHAAAPGLLPRTTGACSTTQFGRQQHSKHTNDQRSKSHTVFTRCCAMPCCRVVSHWYQQTQTPSLDPALSHFQYHTLTLPAGLAAPPERVAVLSAAGRDHQAPVAAHPVTQNSPAPEPTAQRGGSPEPEGWHKNGVHMTADREENRRRHVVGATQHADT